MFCPIHCTPFFNSLSVWHVPLQLSLGNERIISLPQFYNFPTYSLTWRNSYWSKSIVHRLKSLVAHSMTIQVSSQARAEQSDHKYCQAVEILSWEMSIINVDNCFMEVRDLQDFFNVTKCWGFYDMQFDRIPRDQHCHLTTSSIKCLNFQKCINFPCNHDKSVNIIGMLIPRWTFQRCSSHYPAYKLLHEAS